jgi:FkbM family methyltransferase
MTAIQLLQFVTNHPLNKDRKFEAILRFFKWQFGSRLVPGEVVFDWINGAKFLVRNGETGLTSNIYTGLHEFPDMGFLMHVLRHTDLFIDVGANVGSYTILACSAIGASGYAFEPSATTFKRLEENVRLNHLENRVVCNNIAIGSELGVIEFTRDMDTVNHVLAQGEQHANAVCVEVSTLDVVLKGKSPTVMKIDVEGFETPVLQGAIKTLSEKSLLAVIMELNGSGSRYGFDELKILKIMAELGFKSYSYDPLSRALINLEGKNLSSGNTLFVRDEAIVLDRLRSAPQISVHGKSF